MTIRTFTFALLLTAFAAPAFADDAPAGKVAQNPDALAIDSACATEGQTAGCGDKKVGTGLLKCIMAYKKAHRKEFQVSEGCKAALEKAREDRRERKGHGK